MPIPNHTAFTSKANHGILRVLVTPITIIDPTKQIGIASPVNINPYNHTIQAIWDTGATSSVISKNVSSTLKLIPTGKANVSTANGDAWQNTFTVNIGLPHGVIIQNVVVTEVDGLSGGCDALIGMDIITLGDFSITNFNGRTCMSFRLPSGHEIDYVANLQMGVQTTPSPSSSNRYAGTPRNSLCPCGSGKKYKHCHGKV